MAGFSVRSFVVAIVVLAGVSLAVTPRASTAQGAVSGQVSVQERPGETTSDLGNAVVYLVPLSLSRVKDAKLKPMKERMAMQSRQFQPRVRVITVGSKVEFPNQDPFSHNIFSNAPGASFDLGLYGRGNSKATEFRKAGAFPVYCNIHSRMTGFVVAVPAPLYTQAGADGRFTIEDVPAGRYELHVWHERAPEQQKEIVVSASGMTRADTQLDARGFKFVSHKNKFGQDYQASGERY